MVNVVIAGGGTSGWLAASMLSHRLGKNVNVTLVESEQIGTVGVGEATIPTMRSFHRLLEIDEAEFMRSTQATFKLGIIFKNWGAIGEDYIHSFGKVGQKSWMAEFHEFWLEAKAQGFGGSLQDYCLELQAAKAGKFGFSDKVQTNFAYHLDATRYARFLRTFSEARGAKRVEGKIEEVLKDANTGDITGLRLDNGKQVDGDFFVDCTGFRALLIGESLGVDYDDWSHLLASDRAIAVQTESVSEPPPYTVATAHSAGWQWRIPLQHRVGNGIVYSSQFISDDEAQATLLKNVTGPTVTDPKFLRFVTGARKKSWHKNCVSLGLASSFLEPLESTSLHLVMTGLIRLVKLFPFSGSAPALAERFNKETRFELEAIRDFIIMHYKLTRRNDSAFWNHYRELDIPDSLAHRMQAFKENGYLWPDDVALFRVDSWLQVMMGQGLQPGSHHRAALQMEDGALKQTLDTLRKDVVQKLSTLPSHQTFIDSYCKAQDA